MQCLTQRHLRSSVQDLDEREVGDIAWYDMKPGKRVQLAVSTAEVTNQQLLYGFDYVMRQPLTHTFAFFALGLQAISKPRSVIPRKCIAMIPHPSQRQIHEDRP